MEFARLEPDPNMEKILRFYETLRLQMNDYALQGKVIEHDQKKTDMAARHGILAREILGRLL